MKCPNCSNTKLHITVRTQGTLYWELEDVKDETAYVQLVDENIYEMDEMTLYCNECYYETTKMPFDDWRYS